MLRDSRLRGFVDELRDLPDEPKTLARDRADQALRIAAIADRAARSIDAVGYRRIRHDAAVPNGAQQLVLADHAFRILHKINQQVEDLRFDRNRLGAAPQFAARGVEDVIVKRQSHAVCAERQGAGCGLALFMTKSCAGPNKNQAQANAFA
jgi:hypothetical protein